MKSLFLSAALPVLILAAGPALAHAPADPAAASATTPPPHFPRDLTPEGVKAADDHLALEEVDGAEAKAFVAASNEKALSALTGDRRYEPFRQQAEAILTATDRIPGVNFLGEGLGNFWQDAANPKGVWRRTT
ncbi:MAG: S9 family peptidase, partial [Brevundimonas sp.]